MSLPEPIGGYFGLEAKGDGDFPYTNTTLLNSGRNCFGYILSNQDVDHVYIPKFTCDVMLEPLKQTGINYTFYDIDEMLEIKSDISLKSSELIVYTNYFGIKDKYSRMLSQEYQSQLILDCSQAFYFEPLEEGYTFYSPRKFFGIPDGGCLFGCEAPNFAPPIDTSERSSHLFKRIESGAEAGYEDFKKNDASLTGEPIKSMSVFTRTILENIDYDSVKQKRITNFSILHDKLKSKNGLTIEEDSSGGPMVYPFLTDDNGLRQKLIDNKIFVATYWPNVFEWCSPEELEFSLAENIIPLPIDQRYDAEDMNKILEVIHE